MKVSLVRAADGLVTSAQIEKAGKMLLPSLTDGWRFNFKKHSKTHGLETYILVTTNSPEVIEGCLIFQMKDRTEPYMAFIEIAPHNRGENKQFERVAECLIAFACRESFKRGEGAFKGWLAFDVMEERKEDEIRLMKLYSQKYGALRFGETTMVIPPECGEALIIKFLN